MSGQNAEMQRELAEPRLTLYHPRVYPAVLQPHLHNSYIWMYVSTNRLVYAWEYVLAAPDAGLLDQYRRGLAHEPHHDHFDSLVLVIFHHTSPRNYYYYYYYRFFNHSSIIHVYFIFIADEYIWHLFTLPTEKFSDSSPNVSPSRFPCSFAARASANGSNELYFGKAGSNFIFRLIFLFEQVIFLDFFSFRFFRRSHRDFSRNFVIIFLQRLWIWRFE